ncbi:hypothetical protein CE195_02520, partial [Sodalis-like symbiont of Philaenus spumarius]
NEITRNVITQAFEQPGKLNIDRVNAHTAFFFMYCHHFSIKQCIRIMRSEPSHTTYQLTIQNVIHGALTQEVDRMLSRLGSAIKNRLIFSVAAAI